MESEGPRCLSTTKSWLLARLVLELTKVTPHIRYSPCPRPRHHTYKSDIHQHTPPNSPSVPIKRMAQVAGERRGWGSAESIRVWAEFIKTTQVTVLVISLSYRV